MFSRIKRRFQDMRTVKVLCLEAEKHANAEGQKEPGAEHFVLAALELPDGTAHKVFQRVNADPDGYRAAIDQQYQDALRSVGVALPEKGTAGGNDVTLPPGEGLYQVQPSAQALMQRLASHRKFDPKTPLVSAHVVLAAATAQQGVAPRAFRAMGIDPEKLAEAAKAEIHLLRSTS